MPYRERETEQVYFTISEVAEMLNVATSLLRFWEGEFSWLKPKKNKKGNRQYVQNDVNVAKQLHFLIKKRGMTLDGVKMAKVCDYYESLIEFFESYSESKVNFKY